MFVAVGYILLDPRTGEKRAFILTSPDGVAWTARRPPASVGWNVTDVTWSGNQFVAVAVSSSRQPRAPLILTSPDGVRWIERIAVDSGGALSDIAWSGDRFVALGSSTILTSLDGLTWSAQAVPGHGFKAIAWGGSQFVILGSGIRTSPDGITWTQRPVRGEFLYGSTGVAWSGARYVAVGSLRRGWFADYLKALIVSSP
jgi:hypothetical protein